MASPEQVEQIARICHVANSEYCVQVGDKVLGPWEDIPEHYRHSIMAGVRAHLERPLSPVEAHQYWLDTMKANGWTFGTVKDADKKTHPCMVPYEELPESQRIKDYLFGAIVGVFREAKNGSH